MKPDTIVIDVIIEDPCGSTVRHHWDDASGRWLVKSHPRSIDPWPANYGYIPGTHNPVDDDDLDVLVLSQEPLDTGAEIHVRAVGVLSRPDGDDKILGVLVGDPAFGKIENLREVPESSVRTIEDWFAAWSEVGTWQGAEAAAERIAAARDRARKLNRRGMEC